MTPVDDARRAALKMRIVEDYARDFVFGLRDFAEGDESLILDSWKSQIRSLQPFKAMPPEDFAAHKARIERCLGRVGARLACHPDHPRQIYGWCCTEVRDGDQLLHFVYVRGSFRRNRFATRLLFDALPAFRKEPLYVTHPARSMRYHVERWKLVYDPYRFIEEDIPS